MEGLGSLELITGKGRVLQPSLRTELMGCGKVSLVTVHGVLEDLDNSLQQAISIAIVSMGRVSDDALATYMLRNILPADFSSTNRHNSRQRTRRRGVHAHCLVKAGVEVGELVDGGKVNVAFRGVARADLLVELLERLGVLAQHPGEADE